MKKTKKIMTAIGIAGACAGICTGAYAMMKKKQNKMYKQIMTYKDM